ncbi:MAG TPA: glutathione S-transferase [Polyangiaceae bacterium]|nr:glutathione S-transferase [Polyangiaceae bacterium]
MRPVLYSGNQNYSSWSMRPWLALTWAHLDFELRVIPLGGPGYTKRQVKDVLAVSPSGTVPALHVDGDVITDSLSICEWAAERVPTLWPADRAARALARSAACEMHSGFSSIRSELPCNIRRRTEPRTLSEDARREVARVEAIWSSLKTRFGDGGPYLFGANPTIVDAFFTPVATRFRTYGVSLGAPSRAYADALLENAAFREWEEAAKREPWIMPLWDSA